MIQDVVNQKSTEISILKESNISKHKIRLEQASPGTQMTSERPLSRQYASRSFRDINMIFVLVCVLSIMCILTPTHHPHPQVIQSVHTQVQHNTLLRFMKCGFHLNRSLCLSVLQLCLFSPSSCFPL